MKTHNLADKIIKVAVPSITSVTTPQLTVEVDQLCAEIAGLRKLINLTYGTCSLTLDLRLGHTFSWVLIIADVGTLILIAD